MTSSLADLAKVIINDIAPFSDIGTSAPALEHDNDRYLVRYVRHGDQIELEIADSCLFERYGDSEHKYTDLKALLASDRYGNLRLWAARQTSLFDPDLDDQGSKLEVGGNLNGNLASVSLDQIDDSTGGAKPQRNKNITYRWTCRHRKDALHSSISKDSRKELCAEAWLIASSRQKSRTKSRVSS